MWLAARYAARQLMSVENAVSFGVLSNVLLIVVLIFLVVYYKYKNFEGERPSFFADVKDCMKSAMKYVIGSVVGIGIFYGLLTNDIQDKRDLYMQALIESVSTEEGLAAYKEGRADHKNLGREEIIKSHNDNVEMIYSVKFQVVGALLALTVVSLIYSLLAVFFWRSIVKRI